jgi:hypothetical protein
MLRTSLLSILFVVFVSPELEAGVSVSTQVAQMERGQEAMTDGGRSAFISERAEKMGASWVPDRSEVSWARAGDDSLWARGANYKAHFTERGFSFVPFLGSDAPRNFPLRLVVEEIAYGGKAIAFRERALLTREGNRITRDLGGVEEIFEVTPERVQQMVRLPESALLGDMRLRFGVESELRAQEDGEGLRFSNELGGVRYSGALAFDEAGQSVRMPSLWIDGAIEIVVPAEFVARAQGRILVDPLLSTFSVDALLGADLRYADLAYEFASDRYCVVFQERFSGSDGDIYSWMLDGTTGARSLGSYLAFGNDEWLAPSVAYHGQSGKFMMVASVIPAGTAEFHLKGVTRGANSVAVSTSFTLDSGNSDDYWCLGPDIGGDRRASGSSFFFVVYTRAIVGSSGRRLIGQRVNPDGTLDGGLVQLEFSLNMLDAQATISKSAGTTIDTSDWLVAYQRTIQPGNIVELRTQRIDHLGNFAAAGATLHSVSAGSAFTHIAVSDMQEGLGGIYSGTGLVSFGYGPSADTSFWVAGVNRIYATGKTKVADKINLSQAQVLDSAIATTADHFLLSWSHPGGLVESAVVQVVDSNLGFSEDRFTIADSAYPVSGLNACSTHSGGGPNVWSDAMLLWTEESPDTSIQGARLFAIREDINGGQYCPGEINSSGSAAFLTGFGDQSLLSPQELRAQSMPINVFGFFLVGTASGFTSHPAGSMGNLCLSGILGRYNAISEIRFSGSTGTMELSFDPLVLPLATGNVAAVSGQQYYFQAWYRDTVAGSPASNFSGAWKIYFE